jgi:hypothetical protein
MISSESESIYEFFTGGSSPIVFNFCSILLIIWCYSLASLKNVFRASATDAALMKHVRNHVTIEPSEVGTIQELCQSHSIDLYPTAVVNVSNSYAIPSK